MGSLFDGIGGFPLAAVRNGIRPGWASEIEAFPIEVTKLRFPNMIHVGDITKLNGAELPPVNIICGGSPCQDLSVAGARAGLAGARSGLFMEQVRLTKEMRNADELRGRTAIDMQEKFKDFQILHGREEKINPKLTAYQVELAQVEAEIEKLLDTLTGANATLLAYANKKIEELDTRRQTISKAIAELSVDTSRM